MTDLSLQRKVGKEDKEMVIIQQMVNKWIGGHIQTPGNKCHTYRSQT
jgi:hypothetical protein